MRIYCHFYLICGSFTLRYLLLIKYHKIHMVSSLTFHFLTMSVIQLDCCHLPQNCILKMLPLHGADSISEQFKLAAKNSQHLLIRSSASTATRGSTTRTGSLGSHGSGLHFLGRGEAGRVLFLYEMLVSSPP